MILLRFSSLTSDILNLNINNSTVLNFLESNDITIDEYCKRIKDHEWADDIIISLLSKYHNLETRIIRYDKDINDINTFNYGNCTIWLLLEYYSKDTKIEVKNHYSGLIPINSRI